jgi:hypothetical protein
LKEYARDLLRYCGSEFGSGVIELELSRVANEG